MNLFDWNLKEDCPDASLKKDWLHDSKESRTLNFEVEKWFFLNFCFAESSKWACVKENTNEMISVYDYKSVVVWMVLGAWKIKLF
jgi:hypothetical protein